MPNTESNETIHLDKMNFTPQDVISLVETILLVNENPLKETQKLWEEILFK